jgi:hypothetical protein
MTEMKLEKVTDELIASGFDVDVPGSELPADGEHARINVLDRATGRYAEIRLADLGDGSDGKFLQLTYWIARDDDPDGLAMAAAARRVLSPETPAAGRGKHVSDIERDAHGLSDLEGSDDDPLSRRRG